ncbi:MAG: DUF3597 domain-containing protein [Sphingopyxis sp.]|nr:DUF3597 domain-containing protein [Sphingopyxis sp.]
MGIFSSIRNAIFGTNEEVAAPAPAAAPVEKVAKAAEPLDAVDVEAILNEKRATKGQDLNWETSIVDLMKLLDMDSSLQSRKELAAELGYEGPLDGSADMNIRLHRALMKALAVTGGRVPASMMD